MHMKEKVLIIDDEKLLAKSTAMALRREGFDCFEASDGPSGIRLAGEVSPNIILLDITMPGMDGWQVLKALRADEKTRSIPVLVFTAKDIRNGKKLAVLRGANGFVAKPFETTELMHAIHAQKGVSRSGAEFPNIETLLGRLPVGLLIMNGEGMVITYNSLALTYLGVSEVDLIGSPLHHTIDSMELKVVVERLLSGEGDAEEAVINRDDRRIRCYLCRSGVHLETVTMLVGDMTQAFRMNQMENEYLNTISHGLRTPLATLKTTLNLLKERAEELSPEIQDIVSMGAEETNRLETAFRELVHCSRLETGVAAEEMVKERFTIQSLMKRLHASLADSLKYDEGEKSRIQTEENDYEIETDFRFLKTALSEIVKNALIYSGPSGSVRISFSAPSETGLSIVIHDDGVGISSESVPLLFKKFFREDNPITRSRPAYGLGLYIAGSYIELLGGTVYCESTKGKGTTIFVTIPSCVVRSCDV